MKFCKDCKWVVESEDKFQRPRCSHEQSYSNNGEYMVTGDKDKSYYSCEVMRAFYCGHSAKYFEEK